MKKDQKSKTSYKSCAPSTATTNENGDSAADDDDDDSDNGPSDNEHSETDNQDNDDKGLMPLSHARCGTYHSHSSTSHQCTHHSSYSFGAKKPSPASASSSSSSTPTLVTKTANSPSPPNNFAFQVNPEYYGTEASKDQFYLAKLNPSSATAKSYPFYPNGTSPNTSSAYGHTFSTPPPTTGDYTASSNPFFDPSYSSQVLSNPTDPSNLVYSSQFNGYNYSNAYFNTFYANNSASSGAYLANEAGYAVAGSASNPGLLNYQFGHQHDSNAYGTAHADISTSANTNNLESNYSSYLSTIHLASAASSNSKF